MSEQTSSDGKFIDVPLTDVPLTDVPLTDVPLTDGPSIENQSTCVKLDKSQTLVYQFTRHVASCNNINYGKMFGKDFEPSTTIYGILKTIQFSQEDPNKKSYTFNNVCVSNLIRTWITAVLLYGLNTKGETLTLYICPFLKEFHGTFKRGNYPKKIVNSIKKFEKFLQLFYSLVKRDTNQDGYTDDQIIIIKKFIPVDVKLPKSIVIVFPPDVSVSTSEIKIVFNETDKYVYGPINSSQLCLIKDTSGPDTKDKKGFLETGNLEKFMKWFSDSSTNYYFKSYCVDKFSTNSTDSTDSTDSTKFVLVHVVTHSHIMQDYLKDNFKIPTVTNQTNNSNFQLFKYNKSEPEVIFNIDKLNAYKNVRKSNTWRFITSLNIEDADVKSKLGFIPIELNNGNESQLLVPTLYPGVFLVKSDADIIEKIFDKYSLCGYNNSISYTCSSSVTGGKSTRKNKSKTLKKRTSKKSKTLKKRTSKKSKTLKA